MEKQLSIKKATLAIISILILYVLIIRGINICNGSYTLRHKGIFTEEFAHGSFHEIS